MTQPTDSGGELPTRANVLLSAQRALLGRVMPSLRAVVVQWAAREVRVRCYFVGANSAADQQEMSCAETEVIADYRPEVAVEFECLRVDAPGRISDENAWAYARKEPAS